MEPLRQVLFLVLMRMSWINQQSPVTLLTEQSQQSHPMSQSDLDHRPRGLLTSMTETSEEMVSPIMMSWDVSETSRTVAKVPL